MADREKNKQLDEMLDSLLASYSAVEPRPGLETRILANLRDAAHNEMPSRLWNFKWLWAAAAALAAIIVGAVLIGRDHGTVAPPTVVQVRQPVSPEQTANYGSPPKTAINIVGRASRKRVQPGIQSASLPLNQRQQLFPTPTPLSEQEQLFLRYLAGTSREELIAQSHPDKPSALDQDQSEATPGPLHIFQQPSNTR